jgi:primary-amine oxidase
MSPFSSYLQPLSADEISQASSLIRSHVMGEAKGEGEEPLRFVAVSLKEPSKTDVLKFESSEMPPPRRQAEIVTLNYPSTGLASEFVVDLSTLSIVESRTNPAGTQPMFTPEDCDLAEKIVQESAQVAAVMKERYGITDMSTVACDPWSINLACEEDWELTRWRSKNADNDNDPKNDIPARLVQTFMYHRQYGEGMQDNHYAHPIDILPVVDLNARQVIHIGGLDRPAPKVPTQAVNYHRDLLHTNSFLQTTWRSDAVKALNIVQPDGPSFTVSDENFVKWQNWSFQVGFNYREGLVLHNVSFNGRPILNRGSLVEMAVPYADIHPPHHRKCAFDVGDYGLGYCTNSLELGCDCVGHIHYFDAVMADADGNPQTKKKAICMHEEDDGILWKHVEFRNGHNESRRSRELVISFISTVVNCEYLCSNPDRYLLLTTCSTGD